LIRNTKGQFSIIAALLVAVVLIAAVMTTYSSIRYTPVQEQPQILSAVDETNMGLKEMLGFTVGYYGSVLKVTGNMSYAQALARNYLESSLNKLSDIRPEWGTTFNLTSLSLNAKWFSNNSCSEGTLSVNYNLTGLGISGVSYSTSTRLDVEITNSSSASQAQLSILMDDDQPLIVLGKSNLQFYSYDYQDSTWELTEATDVASYANGTYVIDLPLTLLASSYVIQVQDTRGLIVLASSFSQVTSTLNWNTTGFSAIPDYVDNANSDILGTHSDFTAQQSGPDGLYDTLTEQASGVGTANYYPLYYNLLGSTTIAQTSGNVTADTDSNNGNYLQLHSYPSAFGSSTNFGYTGTGTDYQTIENRIVGSVFQVGSGGQAQSITAYIGSTASQSRNVKAAIYSTSGFIASTEERTINSGFSGWVTFNFDDPKPLLDSNTNYILVVWGESGYGDIRLYRTSGSYHQGYYDSETYGGNWPTLYGFSRDNYQYRIYCTYSTVTQYSASVELTGTSDEATWQQLTMAVDSAVTAGTASYTLQLYNFATSQYPSSGDGYQSATLGTSDSLKTQTVTSNPNNFKNSTTYWKLKLTAVGTTATQFDLKIDLAQLTSQFPNYAVNLEEQWLNVNASTPRQDLCIKTGTMSSEPLVVQVLHGGSWYNLMTLTSNYFNNVSLAPYIDSANLTIRFVGSNDLNDPTPDSWNIDAVYLKDEPDINFLVNLQESTFTIEILQNGTMRWLGQDMQLTTQTLPIPPVPVKAIHVNQTISGVNQEIPFQIEDWASEYQIPVGLTSNTTVFSNRQMIVFLLNSKVTDFTIWWDGSDNATQTSMAYTNSYFTSDNPAASTLSNGKITLQFGSFNAKSTVIGTSTYSTATFMRINQEASSYGAGLAYVIHHGVVRDIVQQEAEWGTGGSGIGGVDGCPNLYANIILKLPANATYYTYQLRLMFIDSPQQRTITDLCPIQLTTSLTSVQMQTENNTLAGFPILRNGTGTFSNYASGSWTAHHFSQFISDAGKGAGIMFTDIANQKLYAFDSFPSSTSIGALKASAGLLELLPVSSGQVQFQNAYDITWIGAVATFDGTTPVCSLYDGTTPMGLWILAEYPPTITVNARS
jgi:hypothetical protein